MNFDAVQGCVIADVVNTGRRSGSILRSICTIELDGYFFSAVLLQTI